MQDESGAFNFIQILGAVHAGKLPGLWESLRACFRVIHASMQWVHIREMMRLDHPVSSADELTVIEDLQLACLISQLPVYFVVRTPTLSFSLVSSE
jgi:hypothetical protein